ncbi:MAG TPA: hypothetical protein VFY76_02500 [Nocardioides sp.]|nr:hypothetical protein [Nocardioides sp.]
MPIDDTGVTELLRRASDGLTPDVDRLVSGGITRGRRRRRHALIRTTVASLAVIGVAGGLTAVVPRLGGDDSARDPGVATDGPVVTATEAPTSEPTPAPTDGSTASLRFREVPARQVPEVALSLLEPPATETLGEPDVHLDEPGHRVVWARLDGMVTEFGLLETGPRARSTCQRDAKSLGGTCQEVEEGLMLLTWGPVTVDGVTCQGADVERPGHELWATSCNAASSKSSPPLADEPPLSVVQLVEIAANDYWFE